MLTNMTTEGIASLVIDVPNIWCAGDYVIYHYYDNAEKGFYMAPDRINCFVAHPITTALPDSILGCQDRVIRIVQVENCISSHT